MQLEKFDDATELQALTLPVRETLAEIASGLDARFMKAGTTLASTVETIDRIVQSLDDVGHAFDEGAAGAAVGNLTMVAQRLTQVPQQQAERVSKLTAIREISDRLSDAVAKTSNSLDVLKIYAVNVKISSSGAADFVQFAEQMQRQLAAGEEQIQGFEVKLDDLETRLGGMEKSDLLLAKECARVVPDVPERLISDAAELRARQDKLVALATEVREIARAIQANVAGVLGAIQIGDITRQRLEHVLFGCQLLDTHLAEPGNGDAAETRHHLLSLLSAQLDDIATDFGREAALLVQSLRGIGPDAKRLLAFGGGDASLTDNRQSLRRLEAGIAEADAVTQQLRDADHQAEDIVRLIADTVDDLTVRAKNVRNLRLDVQLMAINIGLRCRRVELIGRPVAVIANEIRTYSEKLDETTNAIALAADELGSVSIAMRADDGDGQLDSGDALAQSLSAIGEGAKRTESAMETAGGEASGIVGMLEDTSEQIKAGLSLEETIQALAVTLSALAGPEANIADATDHPLGDLMAKLRKCYTMATERAIHDQFLLPGMEQLASPAPQAATTDDDDDEDDGLF